MLSRLEGTWLETLLAGLLGRDDHQRPSSVSVTIGTVSVSYTHLDVYKRQILQYYRTRITRNEIT